MIIPDCRTALAWPQPPVRPVRVGVAQARARWKSAPSSSAASSEKTLSSCVSAQTSRDHRPNLPVPLHRRSASAPPLKPAVTGIRQDDDPPVASGIGARHDTNRGPPGEHAGNGQAGMHQQDFLQSPSNAGSAPQLARHVGDADVLTVRIQRFTKSQGAITAQWRQRVPVLIAALPTLE